MSSELTLTASRPGRCRAHCTSARASPHSDCVAGRVRVQLALVGLVPLLEHKASDKGDRHCRSPGLRPLVQPSTGSSRPQVSQHLALENEPSQAVGFWRLPFPIGGRHHDLWCRDRLLVGARGHLWKQQLWTSGRYFLTRRRAIRVGLTLAPVHGRDYSEWEESIKRNPPGAGRDRPTSSDFPANVSTNDRRVGGSLLVFAFRGAAHGDSDRVYAALIQEKHGRGHVGGQKRLTVMFKN